MFRGTGQRWRRRVVMSGSIKRDEERRSWFFVVDVPGPDGKRRQMFRPRVRHEAGSVEGAGGDRRRLGPGTLRAPVTDRRWRAFVTTSWLPMIGQRVRPTTLDGYRRNVANHIVPDARAIPLGSSTGRPWRRGSATLSASGLAPKTVRNVVGVLTKILDDAHELGLSRRTWRSGSATSRLRRRHDHGRGRSHRRNGSSPTSATTAGTRCGGSSPSLACAAARRSGCDGMTSTSKRAR